MIQWWQILLLTLYSAYQICDELTIVSSAGSVFAGFITGLIMGDADNWFVYRWQLLVVRSRVGTFGGASYRRNFWCGSATAFYLWQYWDTDLAITTIAAPVAALDVLDV